MAEIFHGLWIGEALAPLQQISIASYLHFGHEYHLHCYHDVSNIPAGVVIEDGNDTLPESEIFCYQHGEESGSVVAFSDLFRYKVLLDRGGWWVDTDSVCLKPHDFPEPVVLANSANPHAWKVAAGIMKLPPGHDLARLCYEAASQADRSTLRWGTIGPELVTRTVRQLQCEKFVRPPAVFLPIPWWDWKLLVSPEPDACLSLITEETYAVHLWHEMWRREGMHRQAIFPPTSYISGLWRTFGEGAVCDSLFARRPWRGRPACRRKD